MLLAMDEADRWQEQHPNVMVVLADQPAAGTDWRDQDGWGWIFKAWFRTWSESRKDGRLSGPRAGKLNPRSGGAKCA
jgi:hypothetical protein